MREVLDTVMRGELLGRAKMREVFGRIVRGEVDEIELAALIAALRTRGESPEEIAGAAEALREAAAPFACPEGYAYADTCGTGGDGARTVNISTAAAFVAAELGVPVAKHGNRSVSSQCGSADVLEACGVVLECGATLARRCLDEVGLCFLMAPAYHSGLRHAARVRRTLGVRTVFNLLGPLVNPARPPLQVMGVFAPRFCAPLARTLGMLGARAALVVHGDGLDEIALHSATTAALWQDGQLHELTLTPEDAGLERYPLEALRGGSPSDNAHWLRELLAGRGAPAHTAAVAINVGALLELAGKASDLRDGTQAALEALRSGQARHRLDALAEVSRERA